jgi:hypothetical protein
MGGEPSKRRVRVKVCGFTDPEQLRQSAALGIDFSLLIHEDYLYAANYSEGLVVYDISDPTTPILVENNEAFLQGASSMALDQIFPWPLNQKTQQNKKKQNAERLGRNLFQDQHSAMKSRMQCQDYKK